MEIEDLSKYNYYKESSLAFISNCLLETSNLLYLVIVQTFERESSKNLRKFFLTGYKPRRNGRQRRIYGSPVNNPSGRDIKWQLKHIHRYSKKYAESLGMCHSDLEDVTTFLLYEIVHESYLGSCKFAEKHLSKDFLLDIFESCQDLICAIEQSENFSDIQKDASLTRDKLEVLEDNYFRSLLLSERNADTECVIEFVKSEVLMNELVNELNSEGSHPFKKPISRVFLKDDII